VTRTKAESLGYHWQERIPFNKLCGFTVTRWDDDGVRMETDETPELSNGVGTMHGGVVATLIDTAANAAAIVVDDFEPDTLVVTVSMTVNYVGPARGHLVAQAVCTKRGRSLNSVTVDVRDGNDALVAQGLVVVKVAAAGGRAPT
jgi:uncharacterized protein (TIGR00369 family)